MSAAMYNPLPFESSSIPEKYVRKAEVELHETPDAVQQGIKELRVLIAADKSLEGWRQEEDEVLMMFLRARKFDVQRAFKNFKYSVNMQKNYKYLFVDVRLEELMKVCKIKLWNFLPYRCEDGCAILHMKLDNWDPKEISLVEVQRYYTFILLSAIRDPMNQINGVKVIMDFKGNHLRYLTNLCTPRSIYIIYHGSIDCLPARVKAVHVVNPQVTFKICYMLAKPFMSEKLKQRLIFHDTYDGLLNYFQKQVLPAEYGGAIADYGNTDWIRKKATTKNIERLYAQC